MDNRGVDQLTDDIGIDLDAPVGSTDPSRIEAAERRIQNTADQVFEDLKDSAHKAQIPKLRRDQVALSDGRIAEVREAKGRDLEKGAAVAVNPTNPMSLFMAVVSQVTRIDGKGLLYEDLLDMPMADVMKLIGAVGGNVPGASQVSAISS